MKSTPLALALACALLIVGSYAARPSLLETRTFDPDEFQHLHAAWAYQQGQLPYRDFFEHHMPGIYYLLGPLLGRYDVAGNTDDAVRAVFAARGVMSICAAAIAAFTFLLGRRYGGTPVGFVATALLSTNIVFLSRTLEIRPDVPAVLCWVASQYALYAALSLSPSDGSWRRRLFAGSGVLLGMTLVFTQKAVLAGPGFALFTVLYLASSSNGRRSARLLDLTTFVIAAIVPLAAVTLQFSISGALPALVAGVWTNNLGWVQEVTPATTLHWMALRDPWFCALAVGGLVVASAGIVHEWTRPAAAAVLLPTLSLLAGMALIPAPFPQYLLLVLPACAIYGADFLLCALARPIGESRSECSDARVLTAATVTFAIVAVTGIGFSKPYFRHPAIYPALAVAAIVCSAVLVARRRVGLAAVVVLVAMSTYSLQQLTWMAGLSNSDAVAAMRYIHDSTTPGSRIMDGFSGYGWFRPHAAFHWFTAPGVRPRLTSADKAQFAAMLEGCDPRPEVVILDAQLRLVSPEMAALVSRHFTPTRYDLVWTRDPAHDACDGSTVDKSPRTR